MYVQIWVAVDRQFGCKDFRASETTALHWPVWHDVCCDRPWWRDRCPRPYCCRCPVESIGTCQLHTFPAPKSRGVSCRSKKKLLGICNQHQVWQVWVHLRVIFKISRNSILSRSCYHLKYPIYKRFHWNSNISSEVDWSYSKLSSKFCLTYVFKRAAQL